MLMLAYSVAIASTRDFVPDEMIFINVYMMLVGIVVMPKAIFALFSSAGYLLCQLRHRRTNWGNILWLPVALFQIYVVCYGFIFGFGKLEVRHLDLYFDDLFDYEEDVKNAGFILGNRNWKPEGGQAA